MILTCNISERNPIEGNGQLIRQTIIADIIIIEEKLFGEEEQTIFKCFSNDSKIETFYPNNLKVSILKVKTNDRQI